MTPLRRDQVTTASLIMLPTYMLLSAVFGIVYVFDPLGRVDTVHALAAQRAIMPIEGWGVLFLCLALVMGVALAAQSRQMFALALAVSAVAWLAWGCLYAGSVFVDPQAPVLSPVPAWFVSTACVASMISLVRGEGESCSTRQ